MYLCLENFSPNSLNHMHFAYFLNYYLHTISIGGDSNPSSPPCKNWVIPLSYKALGYSFISFSIWFYLSISHSLKYGFHAVSCIHWYSSSSHCCNLVFDIRHMLVNPLLLLLLLQTEEGLRLFSNCLCTFSYLPYTFHNHCNVCLLPPPLLLIHISVEFVFGWIFLNPFLSIYLWCFQNWKWFSVHGAGEVSS